MNTTTNMEVRNGGLAKSGSKRSLFADQRRSSSKKKRGIFDAATALAALSTPPESMKKSPSKGAKEASKEKKTVNLEPKTSNRSGDFAKTFPEKLMDILDDEDNKDVISWLPHGKSFVIHKPAKLTTEILPRYHLKKCKFESFTRKLYFWGFRKISQGKDTDAFYNKLFKSGDFPLCRHIRCRNDLEDLSVLAATGGEPVPYTNESLPAEALTKGSEEKPSSPVTKPTRSLLERSQSDSEIESRLEELRKVVPNEKPRRTVTHSMPEIPEYDLARKHREEMLRKQNERILGPNGQSSLLQLLQQNSAPNLSLGPVSPPLGLIGNNFNQSNDLLRTMLMHRRRHESITAAALSNLTRSAVPADPQYHMESTVISNILRSALDVIDR